MKKLFFLIATFLYAITLPKEFSANFTQTITSSDKKITYKGKVYKLGNEIVWNYTYPSKKTIWVKEKIYVYEPDLYQVTIINKKNTTLNDILKNAKKIKNDLYMADVEDKKIYFIYDKTLKKLFYTDELGNKVEIKFFNQKNSTDKNIFKLSFPNDVDIIYQNQS